MCMRFFLCITLKKKDFLVLIIQEDMFIIYPSLQLKLNIILKCSCTFKVHNRL